MAKSLSIPNGSPVRWLINVLAAGDSINAGEILRNNEAWPHDQTICGIYYPEFSQPFDCDDVVEIQILHENTDDPDIVLEVRDQSTDAILKVVTFSVDSGNYKRASVDLSTITCGSCVYFQLTTISCVNPSIWVCGDSGTFEAAFGTWSASVSTGLTNTIGASATAYEGSQSASVTAAASPGPGSDQILYCTSDFGNINENSYFCLSAFIYDDSTNPFTQDTETVYWEFATGFTDAQILYQTTVTPSEDGRGQWHEIKMVFRTGTDDSGSIRIVTSNTAQANGIILVDRCKLFLPDSYKEAHTERIGVSDLDGCYKLVEYWSDAPSHGFYYSGSTWNNLIRLPVRLEKERFEDPGFNMHRSSDGTQTTLSSRLMRVYEGTTQWMPPWFHEKVAIAMRHQHFKINLLEYKPLESAYTPDYEDDFGSGSAEFKVIDQEYQEQYTYS